jgi:hypothetical protein
MEILGEKIIRLQDSKFKIQANNNNETSIFLDQSLAVYLGLSDGISFEFKINKNNILKALSFTYSFNKKLYKKSEQFLLDELWFDKELLNINNHFAKNNRYKVDISEATGKRFYFKSLNQESNFNLRNILIQDHFKIIFKKESDGIQLELAYNDIPFDNDHNNELNTRIVKIENKKIRTIIFETFKYILEKYGEDIVLKLSETKDSKIEERNYLGLTLPKYFGFEILIGLFENEQKLDNLKSSGTPRFLDEKISVLGNENSYFTSQWNGIDNGRGLSLGNFNKLLADVSQGLLEIVEYDEVYKLIEKSLSNDISPLEKNHNTIYFGAPGTGKSYKVDKIIENLDSHYYERITFHPEYDNTTFIGGYKPISDKDSAGNEIIKYQFVPQAFTNIYVRAWEDLENPYYLVIEEINRGNCAEIFGEIFQLLDRNSNYTVSPTKELKEYLMDEAFKDENHLGIVNGLKLPPNLSILATMNTSDQSLFPMDSAFKRRWDWEYIPICYNPIDDFNKKNDSFDFEIDIEDGKKYSWIKFIEKVNLNHIKNNPSLGMDKCIGNYFIKPDNDNIISLRPFVNKVIFYLWNDVFKDEDYKEIFGENISYEDFFPIETNGKRKIKELFDRIDLKAIPSLEIVEDENPLGQVAESPEEMES